tara:strand:+ start:226953 stop:228245 length:1293 start_codon:yes stop_codon:yes gene_type:complete
MWSKMVLSVFLFFGIAGLSAAASAESAPLMTGFPPPPELRVTTENFMQEPYNRWAFQHIRELMPTRDVYRGAAAPVEIPRSPVALEQLEFKLFDGRSLNLDSWLEQSGADSFLVLHRGKLVYERYLNGMQAHTQHQMFSATKSFIATLALILIDEGQLDAGKQVQAYLPELAGSAFGDATVQQILDMTTSITFSEEYTDREADIWKYGYVFSIGGKPPESYAGPRTIYDYLPTLKKSQAPHGEAFHYVTPNTDVLGWLVSRVSGQSNADMLSERIWQRLGTERDGYFWLEGSGVEMAGGGLNITARDAARFGQAVLQHGQFNGQQIIPKQVAERILQPGNRALFNVLYEDPWYENVGYAYHDMWWTFNNPHKAVSAIGVHGQFIYIDPVAEMVVVKQSSHPEAEGESNEVDGPQIWHQIGLHLMALPAPQ